MVEVTDIDATETDDIEDETILERLYGLTEMFPESVRDLTWNLKSLTTAGVKGLYKFSRSTLWIVGTSTVILAFPAMFEIEKVRTIEEMKKQQQQMLLGPGGMGKGGGGPGGAPPLMPAMGMK